MSEAKEKSDRALYEEIVKQNPGVVLLDGATGYVGSHLTHHLTSLGLSVRCLVRPSAEADDLAFLQSCSAEIHAADLNEKSPQIEKAFAGASFAVHLIGSIAPKRGESFASLHVEQTRRFAELCKRSGVRTAIMVTACGTAENAASEYHRSKWLAEKELRASGLPCVFVRPSLLIGRTFGRRDSKLVRRFRQLIESRPLVPLIGGGVNKIQPLFIGDLTAAIARCIASYPAQTGQAAPVLELGGASIITMREFVETLMHVLGRQRKLISLPIPLATMLASLAELVQDTPIVSRDQITLSMVDNICSQNHLVSELGIKPVSIIDALRSYTKTTNDRIVLPEAVKGR